MQLPVLVVKPDGSRQFFEYPEAFACEREITVMRPKSQIVVEEELVEDKETGEISIKEVLGSVEVMEEVLETDVIQHPAAAWGSYSKADFEVACPGWIFLPVTDTRPVPNKSEHIERLPASEWTVTEAAAIVTYRVTPKSQLELAADLVTAQADAVGRVNDEAGTARAQYITVAIGQEGTYLDKATEAEAFLRDPAPTGATYPYLYEQAAATDTPVADVAALISLTAQAWRPINARIEGLRQGALKRIKEASSIADVDAVFPIPWPQP